MTYQDSLDRFFVEGRYLYGDSPNRVGYSHGDAYLLTDGRVVGTIFDSEVPSERKLILGLFDINEGMKFWKMQSVQDLKCPVIYNLTPQYSPYTLRGRWTTLNDLKQYAEILGTQFPELMDAFFMEKDEAHDLLKTIDKERIGNLCNNGVMGTVRESSNTGQIFLRRF